MAYWDIEYTDTLAGEANYCWVRRATINVPEDARRSTIMRRAKAAMGLSGLRGESINHGDMLEFRPKHDARGARTAHAWMDITSRIWCGKQSCMRARRST